MVFQIDYLNIRKNQNCLTVSVETIPDEIKNSNNGYFEKLYDLLDGPLKDTCFQFVPDLATCEYAFANEYKNMTVCAFLYSKTKDFNNPYIYVRRQDDFDGFVDFIIEPRQFILIRTEQVKTPRSRHYKELQHLLFLRKEWKKEVVKLQNIKDKEGTKTAIKVTKYLKEKINNHYRTYFKNQQ